MEILAKAKLSDLVAESIIKFIDENRLSPGDRLPTEKVIAETLGIGRTSVREGIGKLMAKGLLDSRQGDGVFLQEVTVDTLFSRDTKLDLSRFLRMGKDETLDLLDVRSALENFGCLLAAVNATAEEITELESLANRMAEAVGDAPQYASLDFEFHSLILTMSRNSILPRLFRFTADLIRKQFDITIVQPNALQGAMRSISRLSMLSNDVTPMPA